MTKVLFIAYHFPPEGYTGVQRSLQYVKSLPTQGFHPVVVAGPGSGSNPLRPSESSLVAGISANVPIFRVAGPAPRSKSKLQGRLERWLGMPSSFSPWWIRTAAELSCKVGNEARLIYATMSPFESTDVALKVSERLGIPWVADLRDPWALDEFAIYPTLLHRKLDKWKMERVLSTAALIIMNTPEATKALKEAFPRLHTKSIITITNGFDQEDFATGIPARRDSKFRIVHSGGFATDLGLHLRRRFYYPLLGGCVPGLDMLTRSPWFLLKALERWCDQRPAAVNDLEIVFAGKTLREDLALVHQSRIANSIRLPGYVSHAQSLELIRTADLLFLPMHNLPPGKRSRTIQAKTYEYLASGRPILAAVPDGDAGDFLRQSGSAFVCRPDDVAGMILILDKAYAAWRQGQPLTFSNSEFVAQFEHRNLTQTLANGFRKVLEEC